MDLAKIKEIIPDCCTAYKISINKFNEREKDCLKEYLSAVETVIVLAHHIKDSREWIWTEMKSERNNCSCPADLHSKDISKRIKAQLESKEYNSKVVPYPGVSGIRFKKIAEKTGMGEMGDNFLLLHSDWGPWVHLRVLLTEAKITGGLKNYNAQVCVHCGKCIAACPADALSENDFDIQSCRERQEEMDNSHSCEVCARVCPIGELPE